MSRTQSEKQQGVVEHVAISVQNNHTFVYVPIYMYLYGQMFTQTQNGHCGCLT